MLAQRRILDDFLIQTKRAVWACAHAIAAAQTAIVERNDFWLRGLTFRVVTPPAPQGAAFEKYSGSNSRPVVDREPHHIKDKAGLWRRR
jgi:hypothetical protein